MDSSRHNKKNESDFLRTLLVCAVCIPLIIWLLYSAWEKKQQSGPQTIACQKKCSESGYPGYSFQWGMLSQPTCTCLSSGA
jgi:hypothetical protein